MRIPAISCLMLAIAVPVVSAAPAKNETATRVSYTGDGPKSRPVPTGDWVELASPTPASHGREIIPVEGRYGQLRIDAHEGRPAVKNVRVVYADGKQRVVRIGRTLAGKRATALVELSGAPIDHVVIQTDRRSKGTYTVMGTPVVNVAAP